MTTPVIGVYRTALVVATQPPKAPADCNLDYGQGIQMSAGGAPEFVCAGDTALGGGDPLPYGQSIAAAAHSAAQISTGWNASRGR